MRVTHILHGVSTLAVRAVGTCTQKATLMRAAALRHTDLTDFVLQPALREAKAVIEESERIVLSERDSLLVLNLLENPPAPNAKLRAAIASMPKPARKRM